MTNCASAAVAGPDWTKIVGEELYDHTGETYMRGANTWDNENENLAYHPEYAQQVATLRQELIMHWHKVGDSAALNEPVVLE